MRPRMVALVLGLLALRWLPGLPPSTLVVALFIGAGALLVWRRWSPGLFVLGFAWACLNAQWAIDNRLAPGLDGETFWVEGKVIGLPTDTGASVRFELGQVHSRRAALPERIRLSWFGGPQVRTGERWRLAVKLRQPYGQVNPGGFDHEAWLLSQRIGATGSVKDGQRLQETAGSWRGRVRERLLAADASPALRALVLGDDSAISPQEWRVLQDTGTVHLMVISGQHIGMLAGLLYGLVAGLARLGAWPRRLPWLPCACGLSWAGALAYGALAGFDVPVQRACCMLSVVLLWRLRFRHLGVSLPLLGALVAVLLIEPLASLQPGFWLSFGAVAVLVVCFAGRLGGWPWWQAWPRAQWAVTLGLLPAMLALGLPISLSGALANLFAVPWISLAVLPLALAGTALLFVFPALGVPVMGLSGWLLAYLFDGLSTLAALAPAWLPVTPTLWGWALVAVGTAMVLMPAGVPFKWLGLPLVLVAIWPSIKNIPPGEAQVWQLDVGQGLAVLVRTRHHALLYDTGPSLGTTDAGERVVAPSLRRLGVSRLDALVISHGHADHAGGAASVRRHFPVGQVLAGEPETLPQAWRTKACQAPGDWEWDGVRFSTWRWQAARESNPASCVILVEAKGERFLLSGDIDEAAERALLRERPEWRADWLQAPHHGSRTSSSVSLLQGLGVQQVLIPRGAGNAFGHPHPAVLARYRCLGLQVYDTALHGALRVDLGQRGQPQAWRARARFWRAPPPAS